MLQTLNFLWMEAYSNTIQRMNLSSRHYQAACFQNHSAKTKGAINLSSSARIIIFLEGYGFKSLRVKVDNVLKTEIENHY